MGETVTNIKANINNSESIVLKKQSEFTELESKINSSLSLKRISIQDSEILKNINLPKDYVSSHIIESILNLEKLISINNSTADKNKYQDVILEILSTYVNARENNNYILQEHLDNSISIIKNQLIFNETSNNEISEITQLINVTNTRFGTSLAASNLLFEISENLKYTSLNPEHQKQIKNAWVEILLTGEDKDELNYINPEIIHSVDKLLTKKGIFYLEEYGLPQAYIKHTITNSIHYLNNNKETILQKIQKGFAHRVKERILKEKYDFKAVAKNEINYMNSLLTE